jgi:hypothetical protein
MQLLTKPVYSSLPYWAEQTRYNPKMGQVEPTGHTKAERNTGKPHGGELHDGILL